MKKIIVLSLFSFFLLSGISFADVIPDNSHKVDKCVKITNLDQFIYNGLIGSVIFGDSVKNYIIENNKCLTSGYKFATLKIYSYNK
ncbi:MAG: hypothetical protein U9R00_00480, partial [Patescibacteria group bacterium]|nr:hypothetical protein [Patescibacteria group bacterium]